MSDGLPISTIRNIVFGSDGFDIEGSDPDADTNADIKKLFHDAEVSNKVGQSSGACVAFDWGMPPADDVDAEEPQFWRAPRVIKYNPDAFRKSSSKKFVELLALIRKTFDGHEEEMHEAIETVTKIRDAARAEAMAAL